MYKPPFLTKAGLPVTLYAEEILFFVSKTGTFILNFVELQVIDMARLLTDFEAALPVLSKAVFSQPVDKTDYTKVSIRPVLLKGQLQYQLESFRDNKAFHRNVTGDELMKIVESELESRYRQVLLATQTENTQYSMKQDGSYKRHGAAAVSQPVKVRSHNREKEYILKEGENIPALVDLGVFTQDFKIVRAKYDKYKQINRFIELIDHAFKDYGKDEITILDFGCGKSYLTFILYYYFAVKRGIRATIIGYDLKEDVVDRCGEIAKKYGYSGLEFVRADVTKDVLTDRSIDMIVTLHACDVATDFALHYAISKKADFIFSVPCCQHEVNNSIHKGGQLDILLKHGIIKERVSALLTDAIRANVLEDMGYNVDMIEFIDFEHSPKNIMIRARRTGKPGTKGRKQAQELADSYGFKQTLLELCK